MTTKKKTEKAVVEVIKPEQMYVLIDNTVSSKDDEDDDDWDSDKIDTPFTTGWSKRTNSFETILTHEEVTELATSLVEDGTVDFDIFKLVPVKVDVSLPVAAVVKVAK